MFKLVLMMLFVVKFVVVMLGMMVVIFWCKESVGLCVCDGWPNGGGDGDVVFVVDCVGFDVIIVVICVGCDGGSCGEVLVELEIVAEWSHDSGMVILVCGCCLL